MWRWDRWGEGGGQTGGSVGGGGAGGGTGTPSRAQGTVCSGKPHTIERTVTRVLIVMCDHKGVGVEGCGGVSVGGECRGVSVGDERGG